MGKIESFAQEFAFSSLSPLYGYIIFNRRDNHENDGIFIQTKQVVEMPLLGLGLRFYRLRFIAFYIQHSDHSFRPAFQHTKPIDNHLCAS